MAAKKAKNAPKLTPLGDRVLVERLEAEAVTAGGIVLPDSAKEKPIQGRVVAVGQGRRKEDGTVVALELKVGDRILFGKYGGTDVKLDGEEYLIMKEDDVLALIEE
jgi:chaperonin GroES